MSTDDYFFDVEPEQLLPTLLYGLEPIELMSGNVESLAGYVQRVATAHNVPRSLLLAEITSSRLPISFPESLVRNRRADKLCYINGIGKVAEAWTTIFTQATGREELYRCSLSWMSSVISGYGLLSLTPRYCPACLLDHKSAGTEPFDRLIWHIACVEVCPVHNIRLKKRRCGAVQRGSVYTFAKIAGAGHCTNCGSVAYRCDQTPQQKGTQEEIWIAKQVLDLIQLGTSVRYLNRSDVVRSIEILGIEEANGQPIKLAKLCRLPKSKIWNLTKHESTSRVSISSLLKISSALGYSLVSILIGAPKKEQSVPKTPKLNLSGPCLRPIPYREIEMFLMECLKENATPIPLIKVAKIFGVSPRGIKKAFPDQARELILRSKLHSEQMRAVKKKENKIVCQNVISQLAGLGRSLTLRNAAAITGTRWPHDSGLGKAFLEIRQSLVKADKSSNRVAVTS